MEKITVSAPGKLMLFGEHAVVYGYPCIVTAVDHRMIVSAWILPDLVFELEAPDVQISKYKKSLKSLGQSDIPRGARFVEIAIQNFYKRYRILNGIHIEVRSGFSSQFGLGSSSASTVCTIKALAEIFNVQISTREIFDISYKTVLDIQGKGSGFDVAAATYGGTLSYVTGGKNIEILNVAESPLIIGAYTGIKADTVSIIEEIAQKRKDYPEKVERIFQAIEKLTLEARIRILEGDWERVGTLMNFNQEYLRNLGVSSEKLEKLIHAAKSAGAYGAKLSGAGRGDCMIAIAPSEKRSAVETALNEAGGQVLKIKPNTIGVRIETTDNQDERFIVVDKNDNVLGFRSRYDCHHDKSLIHRSVGALIYNSQGHILLQKRSLSKDTDPGKWGISSAGHVTKGQTYDEAVAREILEELGVVIPVKFVKKFITHEPWETEMAALYTGIFDGPFHVNSEEVDRVKFFDIKTLKEKIKKGEIQLSGGTPQSLQQAGVL